MLAAASTHVLTAWYPAQRHDQSVAAHSFRFPSVVPRHASTMGWAAHVVVCAVTAGRMAIVATMRPTAPERMDFMVMDR